MSNARTYGTIHSEQKPFVIQHADSTDYLLGGSLVMKNGKIDKILFDGGYTQATAVNKTTKDKFAFYYYNQDHLGNNREVVNAKGVVQQVTNYYPFGAPYADATAVKSAAVQPYKYNGKELDLMHGLNTYDYGARQHDPILARWDRMDPLCEKYYSTSPYAYCANNPVKFIDPDGRRWDEYDVNGKKISDLGGNSLDFYHNKNGSVTIKNRSDGSTNIMNCDVISGYTRRSNTVKPTDIGSEFLNETGPVKSLFCDFANSKEGAFSSLESVTSTYLGAALDKMESGESKGFVSVETSNANPLSAGLDMWEQMIGEAGISYYNLGNKVLFALTDSKSNTSLLYHLFFVENRERGGETPWYSPHGHGNTYQTYLWTLPTSSIPKINKSRQLLRSSINEQINFGIQCR